MDEYDDDYWVGFDLGGTKMLAALYDDEFHQLSRQRKKTQGADGVEAGVKNIINVIRATLSPTRIVPEDLTGICIGCPGPLDLDEGIIIEAPNLGWKNVPIVRILENEFQCEVLIANDVDAGVYGEYCFGAARDARCAIGIFPGTGIGGGAVYEGKIFRGHKSSCMEVGHIQVDPNGHRCGCGRRGCLEAQAGRLAVAAQVAQAAYRGRAPYILKTYGTDLAEIRSGALAEAVKAGEKVVEEIIRDAARMIGRAVGDLVNLLNPDVVVLGGGMVEAMPELFVEEVTDSANAQTMPAFVDSFTVTAAKLGDDACILGTAAWARAQVIEAHSM